MKKAFFLVILLLPLVQIACSGSGAVSPLTPNKASQQDSTTASDSDVIYWTSFPVTFTLTDTLNGVCMVSKKLGWACGNNGIVLKYDGDTWAQVDTGLAKNENLLAVCFADENNGWIVGSHGVILAYQSGSWSQQSTQTQEDLFAVTSTRSHTVWVGGSNGTLLTYNGVSWGKILVTDAAGAVTVKDDIYSIDLTDQNNGWACGNHGLILKYDGQKWQIFAGSPSTERLNSVSVISNVQAWIVGAYGTILSFNGTTWNKMGTAYSGFDLYQVQMKSDSDGWAMGQDGTIIYYDGTRWISHQKPEGKPSMNALSFYKETGFAVGQKGTILKFNTNGEPAKYDFLFKGQVVHKLTKAEPYWTLNYTFMNKSPKPCPSVVCEMPLPKGFEPYQSMLSVTPTPTQEHPLTATPTATLTPTQSVTTTPGTAVPGPATAPKVPINIGGTWTFKDGNMDWEIGSVASSELKSLMVKLKETEKEKKQYPVVLKADLKSGDKVIVEAAPVTLNEPTSADIPVVSSAPVQKNSPTPTAQKNAPPVESKTPVAP